MTTTNFSFTTSIFCFILFLMTACSPIDHVNTVLPSVTDNHVHEHHSHEHTSESVYYDFRGLNETQILNVLKTATEEEMALRAESDRLLQYLKSNDLGRLIEQFDNTELLSEVKLSQHLSTKQQEEVKRFIPVDEVVNKRYCRYYKSVYSCTGGGGSTGGTMTTVPNQGDGLSKKKCYYFSTTSGRIHYHHSHDLGSC